MEALAAVQVGLEELQQERAIHPLFLLLKETMAEHPLMAVAVVAVHLLLDKPLNLHPRVVLAAQVQPLL